MKRADEFATKVPEVTLIFWIIKIAATTLGETGGDSVTMTLNWGYLTGTAIFLPLLIALVVMQIVAMKFHSSLYWAIPRVSILVSFHSYPPAWCNGRRFSR